MSIQPDLTDLCSLEKWKKLVDKHYATTSKPNLIPIFDNCKYVLYINHGDWCDPELQYRGVLFNYWDIIDTLYEDYLDYINDEDNINNIPKNYEFYDFLAEDNYYILYDFLESYIYDLQNGI